MEVAEPRHTDWPDWPGAAWASIHTTVENAIKAGTAHVYESADAAGMDWTYDGMVSCQASAVLNALKRDGWTPPSPIPPRPDPAPDPRVEWDMVDEPPDETFTGVDGVTYRAALFDPTGDNPLPLGANAEGGPLFPLSPVVFSERNGWVEVTPDEYTRLGALFGDWA